MRSSGGTKSLLEASVVARMKSRIRLLRRPVVPRRERRCGLGLGRGSGGENTGQGGQAGERAEHEAAAQAIGIGGCHDTLLFFLFPS